MTQVTYRCLSCGAVGSSVRCKSCGGDAEPIDCDFGLHAPVGYTIFSHAQLGHAEPRPIPIGEAWEFSDDPHAGDTVTVRIAPSIEYQARVIESCETHAVVKKTEGGSMRLVPMSAITQIVRHY